MSTDVMILVHTDIDECHSGSNNCGIYATCANLEGSYDCECKQGYYAEEPGDCQGVHLQSFHCLYSLMEHIYVPIQMLMSVLMKHTTVLRMLSAVTLTVAMSVFALLDTQGMEHSVKVCHT